MTDAPAILPRIPTFRFDGWRTLVIDTGHAIDKGRTTHQSMTGSGWTGEASDLAAYTVSKVGMPTQPDPVTL